MNILKITFEKYYVNCARIQLCEAFRNAVYYSQLWDQKLVYTRNKLNLRGKFIWKAKPIVLGGRA